jgi:hypothetical protein
MFTFAGAKKLRKSETMADESSSPPLRTTSDAVVPTASPAARSASCPRRTILERLFPISTPPASTTTTAGTEAVVVAVAVVSDNEGTVLSMENDDDDVETGRGGDGREGAIRQQTAIMSPGGGSRHNRNCGDADHRADDEEALFGSAPDSDKSLDDSRRRDDDDTDSIDNGRPPCAICLERLGE